VQALPGDTADGTLLMGTVTLLERRRWGSLAVGLVILPRTELVATALVADKPCNQGIASGPSCVPNYV
jgi:hypothetical protein